MQSLQSHCNQCGSTAYFGERGHWIMVAAAHRDSDSLTRSNYQVLLERLGGESETVAVENFSHWAVGWINYILVDPVDLVRIQIALDAKEETEDYPVLDDEHWSELEDSEFYEFAEGELKQFDNWETVLHEVTEELNTEIGCDGSEWDAIEETRKRLETADAA